MPAGLAVSVSGASLASETISGGSSAEGSSGGESSPAAVDEHGRALAGGLASHRAAGVGGGGLGGGGGLATSAAAPDGGAAAAVPGSRPLAASPSQPIAAAPDRPGVDLAGLAGGAVPLHVSRTPFEDIKAQAVAQRNVQLHAAMERGWSASDARLFDLQQQPAASPTADRRVQLLGERVDSPPDTMMLQNIMVARHGATPMAAVEAPASHAYDQHVALMGPPIPGGIDPSHPYRVLTFDQEGPLQMEIDEWYSVIRIDKNGQADKMGDRFSLQFPSILLHCCFILLRFSSILSVLLIFLHLQACTWGTKWSLSTVSCISVENEDSSIEKR